MKDSFVSLARVLLDCKKLTADHMNSTPEDITKAKTDLVKRSPGFFNYLLARSQVSRSKAERSLVTLEEYAREAVGRGGLEGVIAALPDLFDDTIQELLHRYDSLDFNITPEPAEDYNIVLPCFINECIPDQMDAGGKRVYGAAAVCQYFAEVEKAATAKDTGPESVLVVNSAWQDLGGALFRGILKSGAGSVGGRTPVQVRSVLATATKMTKGLRKKEAALAKDMEKYDQVSGWF